MLDFSIRPSSEAELRAVDRGLMMAEREIVAITPEAVALLAEALKEALARQFIAGGHNEKPSKFLPGRVRTLETLKLDLMGYAARITMGGGAAYIEEGTPAHGPATAPVMAWQETEGTWITAKHVRGVTRDQFVERAIADVLGANAAWAQVLQGVIDRSGLLMRIFGHTGGVRTFTYRGGGFA